MSNPFYVRDKKFLEDHDYQVGLLNSQSIMIVTGACVVTELMDRPIAERLRDAIDKTGGGDQFKRGVIISDLWWSKDTDLQPLPVISVGGPLVNSLTDQIIKSGRQWKIQDECFGCIHWNNKIPQAALWGRNTTLTQLAVEHYIQDPGGLNEFLSSCWK
jgi:hypothetical protein